MNATPRWSGSTIPGWGGPAPGPTRRLSEVMGWAVQTIDVRAPASAALRAMHQHHIQHLPVLDRGYLEGMLCACDLHDAPAEAPVARYMRGPVITIPVASWTHEAASLMRARDVGALPVLHRGFLIGIVTVGDLTRAHPDSAPPRPECHQCGAHHHVRGHGHRLLCVTCRAAGAGQEGRP